MPRPAIDLHQMVRAVLQHTAPLPVAAERPIRHFEASANVGLALIQYIITHIDPADVYQAVYDRHLGHLKRMVLAELIESFERFLKELAGACIDFLAPYVADDRFDEFFPRRGDHIAVFVNAGSNGRALCESDTWLNNATINRRFRTLLKGHFGENWEFLYPGQMDPPSAERPRAATLAILWQIRHTLAHNVGVLTHSDSMKFRMLLRATVPASEQLVPSIDDLNYVRRFLVETADSTNRRVGARLAQLLEQFHSVDPLLFDPQAKANEVSARFALPLTVAGHVGVA